MFDPLNLQTNENQNLSKDVQWDTQIINMIISEGQRQILQADPGTIIEICMGQT